MDSRLSDTKQTYNHVLPPYPKALGKPTISIPGYPVEDDEPMGETDFHARQIVTLAYQLRTYLEDQQTYVGTDNFIYYQQGNPSKKIAPDIYVVCGVDAVPARRSFYIWAEGVPPTVTFEFLSDSTADIDRIRKRDLYLQTIGMTEYFIHQPQGDRPPETVGWRRTADGRILEIQPQSPPWENRGDESMALKSEALNLWFLTEDQPDKVRLLRPYFPDGTPLPTYSEATHAYKEAQQKCDRVQQKCDRFQAQVETLDAENESLKAELEKLRQRLSQPEGS